MAHPHSAPAAARAPSASSASPTVRGVVATIELLAVSLWLGGLAVLGAIVAPTIFRNVAAPTSADAMTLVFRRFDKVAMACAAIVLAVEAWRAFARSERHTKLDIARVGVAALAAGLAVWLGMVISPRIAALHEAGAIRGLDALGRQLEAVHALAETVAKTELALLVALVALNAVGLAVDRGRGEPDAR